MPTALTSALTLSLLCGGTQPISTEQAAHAPTDVNALLEAERAARLDQVLCYPGDLSPEEKQAIIDRYGALPPLC
ncbi:MAG: hypothetical protein ACF8MJ_02765 [Phycisphaerales bacterium JB050]